MNLNNIQPASGATHNSKRVGRGQGSGKGGTSTRSQRSKIKSWLLTENRF